MDKGNIPVTWQAPDYINLGWEHRDNIEYRLSSNVPDLHLFNVGVATCSHQLPDSLTQVQKHFKQLKNTVVAINKMTPGQVLPFHGDNYIQYRELHHIPDSHDIMRVIVFLHDPAPGHQLWIQDAFCTGPAGSWFSWYNDTTHMAANLASVHRYVMQITGTT